MSQIFRLKAGDLLVLNIVGAISKISRFLDLVNVGLVRGDVSLVLVDQSSVVLNGISITLDLSILSIVLQLKVGDLPTLSSVNTRQKVDLLLVGCNVVSVVVDQSSVGLNGSIVLAKFLVYHSNVICIGLLIQLRVIQSSEVCINFSDVGNPPPLYGEIRQLGRKCCGRESTSDRDRKNRLDHCLLHFKSFLDIRA